MLQLAFTLDYEIHGNGEGSPRALMVEPTTRLLRLLNDHGAKLTIMADVAEILKFKEYRDTHGTDRYDYEAIADQLRTAVASGHDVQLHLHSSYFNARHEAGGWVQDWSEYDFARLPFARADWMIRTGRRFLESLLQPVAPGYRCVAFRAANWSMQPSADVVDALLRNGITLDTSVFKFGRRDGLVQFDYTNAPEDLEPWRAAREDVCVRDESSDLWEVPIYSERRWIGAFLSAGRIHRALVSRRHTLGGSRSKARPSGAPAQRHAAVRKLARMLALISRSQAWKADFNQCSGAQLAAALERASTRHDPEPGVRTLPFVLIGHSKLFDRANEARLAPLLEYARGRKARFGFTTLSEVRRAL